MLGKYVWECAMMKSNFAYFLKYRSKVGDNYTRAVIINCVTKKGKDRLHLRITVFLIGGSGRRNKRRLTRKAMNTAEQLRTGFDVLFWYVLRKEKARQGCMADFKFFEKP